MTRASWNRRAAALAALLLFSVFANAHRQPVGLTTIERNDVSGTIEIVHRFHRHDAELALAAITRQPDTLLIDLESQARFALYVAERFVMAAHADDPEIALNLLGAELDGDYILVYQDCANELPVNFAVRNDALRDIYPEQVNHVNIRIGSDRRTLTFAKDDSWRS